MSDSNTAKLALPLLQPAQAQKHVTVNEALLRLDGQCDLVLQGLHRVTPPDPVRDGECWAVPSGGVNAWEGQDGKVAIGANGGWIFVQPSFGRRAFVADQGAMAIHDGRGWAVGALSMGAHGSGIMARQMAEDVTIAAGGSVSSSMVLPNAAMVIGVTARVLETITGTLATWRMGTDGALDRFGQGLGKEKNSWARGMLSQPVTYWQPSPILLSATGGQFQSGRVRIVAHWLELTIPA